MKHLVGVALLVAIAVVVRFVVLLHFGVDIHTHDSYWAVPVRKTIFWILLVIAVAWLVIAVYKFVRHSSSRP